MAFLFVLASLNFALNAQVLATVGNTKITVEDFNRRLDDVRKQTMNPPTTEQFLEDMIRFEVGVHEAEKAKISDDPAVKDRFKQVMYNAWMEKKFAGKMNGIKVTEKDLKEYYKKNPELRLSHVLIEMKDNPTVLEKELARKQAIETLDVIKKSKKGEDSFVDIGVQSRATLPPALFDAAAAMKTDEIKGPVESRLGFHILKLMEKRPYEMADKQIIRSALMEDRRAKMFDDYFANAKKGYKVEINKEALKSAVK